MSSRLACFGGDDESMVSFDWTGFAESDSESDSEEEEESVLSDESVAESD